MQEKQEKVAALLQDEAFRKALSGASENVEVLALFRQFGVDLTGEELTLILQGGMRLPSGNDELSEDVGTWTVKTEAGRWVFTGRQVRWSWPGYVGEANESELGLNILDRDVLFDDLFEHVYHYVKVNRRSKVTFVG